MVCNQWRSLGRGSNILYTTTLYILLLIYTKKFQRLNKVKITTKLLASCGSVPPFCLILFLLRHRINYCQSNMKSIQTLLKEKFHLILFDSECSIFRKFLISEQIPISFTTRFSLFPRIHTSLLENNKHGCCFFRNVSRLFQRPVLSFLLLLPLNTSYVPIILIVISWSMEKI